MPPLPPIRLVTLAVLLAGVTATGCTETVAGTATFSHDVFERSVANTLEEITGYPPDGVSCPDAVRGRSGETTRCVLTDGDERYGVTVTFTDDRGNYTLEVDEQPKP
ncbi:DUF4333 domain-containing protein [Haloechinothrix sp. LS1_15]|uniref:DUF4333 domain-containing protein n=1 Tax=Haloechinothrix sp. LS1_15 TaxID=2652248 RepID=UPI002945C4E4|nr:DUF4333 domain-containing protein [Haloechinothrix sp. LS1_15]MDV6012619.1 DUF4333 domain-containing protein [Haloechinothrix sp. LS1_15]